MSRLLPMFIVLCVSPSTTLVGAESGPQGTPLSLIQPGTTINGNKEVGDGSRLVLLAKPRVAAGDVSSASASVRRYASMFSMVLVARVVRTDSGEFQLKGVAVGNCVRGSNGWTVVSTDAHEEHGVKLDFFARQVLARSESNLRETRVIAKSDGYQLFDANAVVRMGSEHERMKIRHLVWVNKKSGRLATLQWLLRRSKSGGLEMVDSRIHALPPNYLEDRVFSVKADEFTLGVPSDKALAIDRLPEGRAIPVSPQLEELAKLETFTEFSQAALVAELNRAIQQTRQ